jgi:predicted HTH domain antitoxin
MNISFELPPNIEEQIRTDREDLNSEAREAYLVELYRQERITQRQLAEALGLSRVEADGVLKKHKVWLELTPEEVAAQAASLRDATPK